MAPPPSFFHVAPLLVTVLLSSVALRSTWGFSPNGGVGRGSVIRPPWGTVTTTTTRSRSRSFHKLFAASADTSEASIVDVTKESPENDHQEQLQHSQSSVAVRAPIKYVGPYPCLALRFPALATSNQRQRNVTGVSLDFVLDTAANTNTIQQQVANELLLDIVGRALPGVGSSGIIAQGADTYMLGDAQLEGISYKKKEDEQEGKEDEQPFTFMTELTASALPVASPAAAGLLSLPFFQCFSGGVEFTWGGAGGGGEASSNIRSEDPNTATANKMLPSITFYSDKSMDEKAGLLKGRTKVTIDRIPITQLPSLMISINGVEMPALLDTGSPITVVNAQAAALAGIETKLQETENNKNSNPLKAFANRFQQAQAASRGDVLMILGSDGRPVNLYKSNQAAKVEIRSDAITEEEIRMGAHAATARTVDFGALPLYVGELPGLAALNGLGVKSPPAVVLGMDVLRQRPSMLLRAQDNEVWFD